MKIEQWTRLPVIRLFRLGLIGICLHLTVFLNVVGLTVAISYYTGIYRNLEWPKGANLVWCIAGQIVGLAVLVLGLFYFIQYLKDRLWRSEDIRVAIHLVLIAYWVLRCALSLCLMCVPNWLALALIGTLEVDLLFAALGLVLIFYLGYLLLLIPIACFKQCREELARDY